MLFCLAFTPLKKWSQHIKWKSLHRQYGFLDALEHVATPNPHSLLLSSNQLDSFQYGSHQWQCGYLNLMKIQFKIQFSASLHTFQVLESHRWLMAAMFGQGRYRALLLSWDGLQRYVLQRVVGEGCLLQKQRGLFRCQQSPASPLQPLTLPVWPP